MTLREKEEIDAMDYKQMLRRWRSAPISDPYFTGDRGRYFSDKFNKLRQETDALEMVRISKEIGW